MRRLKLSVISETKNGALIEAQGQRRIVSRDSPLYEAVKNAASRTHRSRQRN